VEEDATVDEGGCAGGRRRWGRRRRWWRRWRRGSWRLGRLRTTTDRADAEGLGRLAGGARTRRGARGAAAARGGGGRHGAGGSHWLLLGDCFGRCVCSGRAAARGGVVLLALRALGELDSARANSVSVHSSTRGCRVWYRSSVRDIESLRPLLCLLLAHTHAHRDDRRTPPRHRAALPRCAPHLPEPPPRIERATGEPATAQGPSPFPPRFRPRSSRSLFEESVTGRDGCAARRYNTPGRWGSWLPTTAVAARYRDLRPHAERRSA